MTTAIVFPGQGSQSVGMGRSLFEDFPAARLVFEEVDAALGEKLSDLIFDGPQETLSLTRNAQPALMAVSLAALRALETEKGLSLERDVSFLAGHSLGEYTALAASSVFGIADTARLLRLRGEAMQAAVPQGQGGMTALLGVDRASAEALAARAAAESETICALANDNGGGQIVVSGHMEALRRISEIAQEEGRRVKALPVSAPFHCSLMAPAAAALGAALADLSLKDPTIPVVANVTARPVFYAADVPDLLTRQVSATVRWAESIAFLVDRQVSVFIEVGAGKALSGIIKRQAREASLLTVGDAESVRNFAL